MKLINKKFKPNKSLAEMSTYDLYAEMHNLTNAYKELEKKGNNKNSNAFQKWLYQYNNNTPMYDNALTVSSTTLGLAISAIIINSARIKICLQDIIYNHLISPEKIEKTTNLMTRFGYDNPSELASAMIGKDSTATLLYYESGARDYILNMLATQSATICTAIALIGSTYYLAPKMAKRKIDKDKQRLCDYQKRISSEINSREK